MSDTVPTYEFGVSPTTGYLQLYRVPFSDKSPVRGLVTCIDPAEIPSLLSAVERIATYARDLATARRIQREHASVIELIAHGCNAELDRRVQGLAVAS